MRLAAGLVIATSIALVPVASRGDQREDLAKAMVKCADTVNNEMRLACYDALSLRLKSAPVEPEPSQPATASPSAEPAQSADNPAGGDHPTVYGISPAQQTHPEQFGAERLAEPASPSPKPGEAAPPQPPQALDSINAKVTDYAFNPFGTFVVFLDNGQVWQQLQSDTDRARFNKSGENVVVISRGFLGSYNLLLNDAGTSFKVRRIK